MNSLDLARYLTSPTNLHERLIQYEKECGPDVRTRDAGAASFSTYTVRDGDYEQEHVTLEIDSEQFVFSSWARSQLLSHLGTREKWFSRVSREIQIEELNRRLPAMGKFRLRPRTPPEGNYTLVRGMVSEKYAELQDTRVMEDLLLINPKGDLLRGYSTKSNTSMYAYMVNPTPMKIPGASATILGGVVVRNSEVGYTSLWACPFLVWLLPRPDGKPPHPHVCVDQKAGHSRSHRGEVSDLRALLKQWLDGSFLDAQNSGSYRVKYLASLSYPYEDDALLALDIALSRVRATTAARESIRAAYKRAAHSTHTGLGLFEAVLSYAGTVVGADDSYTTAVLAGALLVALVN